MKTGHLLTIALLLTIGALYLLIGYIPRGHSEIARRGVRTTGEVLLKDTRPGPDGRVTYTVSYVFKDEKNRNYTVENAMEDLGRWESMRRGKEIRVYYLPDRPQQALVEGAVGMMAPRSNALRFLAWSALIAGGACWYGLYLGWKRPKPPPPSIKVQTTRPRKRS